MRKRGKSDLVFSKGCNGGKNTDPARVFHSGNSEGFSQYWVNSESVLTAEISLTIKGKGSRFPVYRFTAGCDTLEQ
jgi:hypothetical protein